MGGTVEVESRPGEGSIFRVSLELARAAGPAPAEDPAAGGEILALLLSPDRALTTRLSRDLAAAGVVVDTVGDIGELTAAIRTAAGNVARRVVLVDERCPGLNVEELAVNAGALDPDAGIHIVLLTDRAAALRREAGWRRLVTALVPHDYADPAMASLLHAVRPELSSGSMDIVRAARPCHILVADDNRTNRTVIGKILERAGHSHVFAENGEEALDALDREAFDMVLMDVNMPVMSGLDAAGMYRFSNPDSELPLLALTADATDTMRRACREAGLNEIMTKPVRASALLQVIERFAPAGESGAAPSRPAPEAVPESGVAPVAPVALADPIDRLVLEQLRELGGGGSEFLDDLIGDFIEDAALLIEDLATAVRGLDLVLFRDTVHTLRSAAANVGARAVYQACLEIRGLGRDEIARDGEQRVRQVRAEFARVCDAFGRLPSRDAGAPVAMSDSARSA